MGEKTRMDDKGRVTVPASIKSILGKRVFEVELVGKDAIILRAASEKKELVAEIEAIRLRGDKERARRDATIAKDEYGGTKL